MIANYVKGMNMSSVAISSSKRLPIVGMEPLPIRDAEVMAKEAEGRLNATFHIHYVRDLSLDEQDRLNKVLDDTFEVAPHPALARELAIIGIDPSLMPVLFPVLRFKVADVLNIISQKCKGEQFFSGSVVRRILLNMRNKDIDLLATLDKPVFDAIKSYLLDMIIEALQQLNVKLKTHILGPDGKERINPAIFELISLAYLHGGHREFQTRSTAHFNKEEIARLTKCGGMDVNALWKPYRCWAGTWEQFLIRPGTGKAEEQSIGKLYFISRTDHCKDKVQKAFQSLDTQEWAVEGVEDLSGLLFRTAHALTLCGKAASLEQLRQAALKDLATSNPYRDAQAQERLIQRLRRDLQGHYSNDPEGQLASSLNKLGLLQGIQQPEEREVYCQAVIDAWLTVEHPERMWLPHGKSLSDYLPLFNIDQDKEKPQQAGLMKRIRCAMTSVWPGKATSQASLLQEAHHEIEHKVKSEQLFDMPVKPLTGMARMLKSDIKVLNDLLAIIYGVLAHAWLHKHPEATSETRLRCCPLITEKGAYYIALPDVPVRDLIIACLRSWPKLGKYRNEINQVFKDLGVIEISFDQPGKFAVEKRLLKLFELAHKHTFFGRGNPNAIRECVLKEAAAVVDKAHIEQWNLLALLRSGLNGLSSETSQWLGIFIHRLNTSHFRPTQTHLKQIDSSLEELIRTNAVQDIVKKPFLREAIARSIALICQQTMHDIQALPEIYQLLSLSFKSGLVTTEERNQIIMTMVDQSLKHTNISSTTFLAFYHFWKQVESWENKGKQLNRRIEEYLQHLLINVLPKFQDEIDNLQESSADLALLSAAHPLFQDKKRHILLNGIAAALLMACPKKAQEQFSQCTAAWLAFEERQKDTASLLPQIRKVVTRNASNKLSLLRKEFTCLIARIDLQLAEKFLERFESDGRMMTIDSEYAALYLIKEQINLGTLNNILKAYSRWAATAPTDKGICSHLILGTKIVRVIMAVHLQEAGNRIIPLIGRLRWTLRQERRHMPAWQIEEKAKLDDELQLVVNLLTKCEWMHLPLIQEFAREAKYCHLQSKGDTLPPVEEEAAHASVSKFEDGIKEDEPKPDAFIQAFETIKMAVNVQNWTAEIAQWWLEAIKVVLSSPKGLRTHADEVDSHLDLMITKGNIDALSTSNKSILLCLLLSANKYSQLLKTWDRVQGLFANDYQFFKTLLANLAQNAHCSQAIVLFPIIEKFIVESGLLALKKPFDQQSIGDYRHLFHYLAGLQTEKSALSLELAWKQVLPLLSHMPYRSILRARNALLDILIQARLRLGDGPSIIKACKIACEEPDNDNVRQYKEILRAATHTHRSEELTKAIHFLSERLRTLGKINITSGDSKVVLTALKHLPKERLVAPTPPPSRRIKSTDILSPEVSEKVFKAFSRGTFRGISVCLTRIFTTRLLETSSPVWTIPLVGLLLGWDKLPEGAFRNSVHAACGTVSLGGIIEWIAGISRGPFDFIGMFVGQVSEYSLKDYQPPKFMVPYASILGTGFTYALIRSVIWPFFVEFLNQIMYEKCL